MWRVGRHERDEEQNMVGWGLVSHFKDLGVYPTAMGAGE